MKMRRTLLKLLITTCFFAACWQTDVSAAGQPTVNLNEGSIYIGTNDDGDFIGYGDTADAAAANKVPNVAANHNTGYKFEGNVYSSKDITINAGKGRVLNLTFNNFKMDNGTHLNILSGTVNITLIGTENSLTAKAGTPAITVDSDKATLYFKGGGKIRIDGADNSNIISGGGIIIDSGTVTLNKRGAADSCNGQYIQVNKQGSLFCYDTNTKDPAELGSIDLYQEGGAVTAAGLYEIVTKEEAFKNDTLPIGEKVTIKYTNSSNATQTIDTNVNSEGLIPIDEELFGKTVTVGRQRLLVDSRPDTSSGAKATKSKESHALEEDGEISNIDVGNTEYVKVPEEDNVDGKAITSMIELDKYIKAKHLTWEEFNFPTVSCGPGYYYIRIKANGQSFASNPIRHVIHIQAGEALELTPPDGLKAVYGYLSAPEGPITIENYGSDTITINDAILKDGTNKTNFTISDAKNISISGRSGKGAPITSSTDIKLTPKTGLDAGTYKVDVQISYKIGSKGNETRDVTVTFEVEKQEQPQPTGLSVTNITHDSATLNGIDKNPQNKDTDSGVEYCFSEDGEWNDKTKSSEPKFSKKLSPGTKYYFMARYKESKNYKPSEPVMTEAETEKATTIYYEKQQLVFPHDDREYTIAVGKDDKPQTYKDILNIKIPDEWCGKTITVTDKTNNGTQNITIPAIRKAPTPKAVDEVIIGAKGEITNVDTSMEFRKKSGKNWIDNWEDCPGKKITEAEPGDYQVRRKFVPDKEFASASATITVHKGPSIEVQLQGADFEEIPYGTPRSGKIIIQNRDTIPVRLEGISLSAENFVITEGEKSIESGDSVEWGIQPKEKLNVGTYESDIVVSYDDSQDDGSDDGSNDNTPGGDTENPDDNTPGGDTENPDNNTPGGDTENPDNNTPGGDTENPDDNTPGGDDTQDTGDAKKVKAQAEGDANEVTDEEESNIRTASIEVKATIIKAEQPDVPPVPAEKSKTATSITLETIPNNPATGAKAQYSKDGGRTWQDSPTFTGLSPNREYTFTARYGETENYNPSNPSNGEIAITTAEKDDKDTDGVKSQTTDDDKKSNNSNNNGTGTGTNGNGTGTGTNGNGTGTNGNGSSSDSKGLLSSAKTGDLNNIQLWVTLMIGSYLSCAVIVKNRLKKAKS